MVTPIKDSWRRPRSCLLAGCFALASSLLWPSASSARDRHPGFSFQSLDLPGIPAAVIPADINHDGLDDLVVMVAYTEWGSKSEFEQTTFKDIEGLVEVMTVVPALLDHRELRIYQRQTDSKTFTDSFFPVELTTSTHALEAGHSNLPLIALTDEGPAAVDLGSSLGESPLNLTRLDLKLESAGRFSENDAFFSDLRFLHDLNNDDIVDLVIPTVSGWSVYQGNPSGFSKEPSANLLDPREALDANNEAAVAAGKAVAAAAVDREDPDQEDDDDFPDHQLRLMPAFQDINGDHLADLVLFDRSSEGGPFIFINRGKLLFSKATEISLDGAGRESRDEEEIVFIGDLDGDGRAELVTQEMLEIPEEAGFRMEIEDAKRPHGTYRIYDLSSDLALAKEPTQQFDAIGYMFESESDDLALPGGFQDLDGDGRQDLVSITLDFSILPFIARLIAVQRISLQMDFQVKCQTDTGNFVPVPNLDLSGKFKLDLNNAQIKHLSQFSGDFNGDGRADFVQLGRGRKVTIHFGDERCRYRSTPDRTIRLRSEPQHLGFVRIVDLNGDGLSDLYVVHPKNKMRDGEGTPVQLHLYLSE